MFDFDIKNNRLKERFELQKYDFKKITQSLYKKTNLGNMLIDVKMLHVGLITWRNTKVREEYALTRKLCEDYPIML